MSSNIHYCDIDSLEGLDEAIAFFDGGNHGRDDQIVFRVTGCEPLATAPELLRKVKRAKKKRGSKNLSIEGLDELEELRKRVKEVEANKAELECMRAQASSRSQDPYNSNSRLGDPDHTSTWRHTTDMESLQSCVANMDINAMRALDQDVHGNIARFEHHRAMVADVAEAATNHYIPDMYDQLWGNYWNNNNPTNNYGNGNEEE